MDFIHNNTQMIAEYIRSGEKRNGRMMLGVEVEHFVADEKTGISKPLFDSSGYSSFLEELSRFYPERVYTDGKLFGLKSETAVISVEPASQLEISIAPMDTIAEIKKVYSEFRQNAEMILAKDNLVLVNKGYHPVSKIDDIPIIQKKRYQFMSSYMPRKGRYALNMMKGTCSLQVSIDYMSPEDFAEKIRLAYIIAPILFYITDNTVNFEGIKAPPLLRMRIWEETDPDRCGAPDGVLDKQYTYNDYAEWIYRHPPILIIEDGDSVFTGSKPCSEIYESMLMSDEEVAHALGMFFPDVRVKTFLEIRCGDSLDEAEQYAYTAFIKGIFYTNNLSFWLNRFKNVTSADESAAREALKSEGDAAELYGYDVRELVIELLDTAYDALGEDRDYLIPLYERLCLTAPAKGVRAAAVCSQDRRNQ